MSGWDKNLEVERSLRGRFPAARSKTKQLALFGRGDFERRDKREETELFCSGRFLVLGACDVVWAGGLRVGWRVSQPSQKACKFGHRGHVIVARVKRPPQLPQQPVFRFFDPKGNLAGGRTFGALRKATHALTRRDGRPFRLRRAAEENAENRARLVDAGIHGFLSVVLANTEDK